MTDSDSPADHGFRIRLANRLTELRLKIDLGEISTRAAFENGLERDGGFSVDDPRVRNACAAAGLEAWLSEPGAGAVEMRSPRRPAGQGAHDSGRQAASTSSLSETIR